MDIAGYNSACNALTARGRLAGITSLPLIFLCLYCNICLAFMPAKRYCEVGVAVLRHPDYRPLRGDCFVYPRQLN